MTTPFDHGGDDTALLEPFDSVFGFLADLHDQVCRQIDITDNPSARVVLEHVKKSIEAGGIVVRAMGG